MIKLERVNKFFNRHKSNQIHVINNTTLDLPDTGIVTLLGPSGCGKTTLLNAIGGLDKVASGKIIVDGDVINRGFSGKKDNIRNAKIGYIFQNFNLLDDKTVFENVALVLRMIGIKDKKVIEDRVNYCLESVGIYQYRHKTADALSGGQRQRVAIARAIAKNPKIIIADEPTGNLDSANTIEVMNIIKKISRDRLVVLVTHERKIAEFYSERIIEMKDGSIVSDRLNEGGDALDYQLENKIYLKDMAVNDTFESDGVKINLYSDQDKQADIKVVIRGGNIYISTDGVYNIVDEAANIELIDDHYSAMDASIYEDNSFEYDKHMPPGFKAKYKSIYTPWNMLGRGFRSVHRFKMLKKLLLVGFLFSSMFSFYAVSNSAGIVDINDADFMTTHKNYVTVTNPSHDSALLKKIAKMDGVSYVLPGNSMIQLPVPVGTLLQTRNAVANLTASLTYAEQIDESALVAGKLPEGKEVVVDRMVLDKFLRSEESKTAGVTSIEHFVGREVKIHGLQPYVISGISDTGSPAVYAPKDQCMFLLTYAEGGTADTMNYFDGWVDPSPLEDGSVLDYNLAPKAFALKKGEMPDEDYECVVSYAHAEDEEYRIGKQVDAKMNGTKLTIVGYYTTDLDRDYIYVTPETVRKDVISGKKVISVYAENPEAVADELNSQELTAKINYDRDRSKYIRNRKESVKSSLIVAGLILLVSLIEMYLMLRSSFLSRIKEIGTLRAIGLKKKDVYRMFSGEIIAITLLTAVPGIAFMYYALGNISAISYDISNNYIVTPAIAGITFAIMLLFNMIAGLIPVWRTMRKTPAAILARNDI